MPKCPKCNEEIEALRYDETLVSTGEFRLAPMENKTAGEYEESDKYSHEDTDFYCPMCSEELFDSEKDAIEFLKGE